MLLSDEKNWPPDITEYLERNRRIFSAWELSRSPESVGAPDIDEYVGAIAGLREVLDRHTLRGFHCTRLTEPEIDQILLGGMQPPSRATLCARIDAIQATGLIGAEIAERLTDKNEADEGGREGMIWFCFFPPHLGGQIGIEQLLRFWGGEALYIMHKRDPVTGPILGSIGRPCVVEADVPIASLAKYSYLGEKVARRFLISRGLNTGESVEHEDRAMRPISAANIRQILRFPEPDFVKLTRCDHWTPPLM